MSIGKVFVLRTSRSCVLWWTVRSLFAGLLSAIASGGCKCWQSKRLRTAADATWYDGNKKYQGDFEVPFFADHIRALTEGFDFFAGTGFPRVYHLGTHVCRQRADRSRQKRCSEATAVVARLVKCASRGTPKPTERNVRSTFRLPLAGIHDFPQL